MEQRVLSFSRHPRDSCLRRLSVCWFAKRRPPPQTLALSKPDRIRNHRHNTVCCFILIGFRWPIVSTISARMYLRPALLLLVQTQLRPHAYALTPLRPHHHQFGDANLAFITKSLSWGPTCQNLRPESPPPRISPVQNLLTDPS